MGETICKYYRRVLSFGPEWVAGVKSCVRSLLSYSEARTVVTVKLELVLINLSRQIVIRAPNYPITPSQSPALGTAARPAPFE